MMRYIVTGADGKLAGRVADNMIKTVGGENVTLTVWNMQHVSQDRLDRWHKAGVRLFEANYDDVDALNKAFSGGDRVYIVSGLEVGKRVQQHKNAIDAAINQNVGHITYSSFVGATDPKYAHLDVTPDHTATENYLKETGHPYTALRNSLYIENYLTMYPMLALASNNVWASTAMEGRATLVAKDDAADAATAALLGKVSDFRSYNIFGSQSISVRELCQLVNNVSGLNLMYDPVDDETYYQYLEKLHIPRTITGDFSQSPVPFSGNDIVSNDDSIRDGLLDIPSNDIEILTGHKPKTAKDIVHESSYVWENHITNWSQMR
ncbi:MAG: NmrA family NAD(P)-binding protein [Leuconostoc gelidum]|jgi:NAD(P)H dehydrogenase (quinone)|uniref:NmrA family NAD(P)-binding protein n=1 Tax=Leuconostoc gelidum TaxID=1244 RepID=UPI001A9B9F91|nr:NmrA family NAD(P)-binding protein [Leuconostoc gelidum]MBZ5978791.1 NmrA family NAD(P)-binding protein [Leuconostoc gelidum subsp. gelidum]MBZ6001801.1 NmrA family NAD(P)-binding protein [Leuconostoc gelidum subsp. gelidum]MBZ6014854.1 NmrA family NAD(P)-binding protein [Leuconostoc gelidum subsp. gelidum]